MYQPVPPLQEGDIMIEADSLIMLCDPNDSVAVLKVLDVHGAVHRLTLAGFQLHDYLRNSNALPPTDLSVFPTLGIEDADWDIETSHVMVSCAINTHSVGLVLSGNNRNGNRVIVILIRGRQQLFRHYVESAAPLLVDLQKPLGNA